jgi:hypothetical protein
MLNWAKGGGGGVAVVQVGDVKVTLPFVQRAITVPVVGSVVSLSGEVVPLAPPG